jgi:hypothetical protein
VDNIEMDLVETEWGDVNWTGLAQDRIIGIGIGIGIIGI